MKIERVSYRRLQTFGQYNNETVEAQAILSEGEGPEEAMVNLQIWVDAQLSALQAQRNERVRRDDTIDSLMHQEHEWERKAQAAREKYERIVEWFADRNIPLPDRWNDGLPF